jgi:hypothetical protein
MCLSLSHTQTHSHTLLGYLVGKKRDRKKEHQREPSTNPVYFINLQTSVLVSFLFFFSLPFFLSFYYENKELPNGGSDSQNAMWTS